jgi:hypothetical protein
MQISLEQHHNVGSMISQDQEMHGPMFLLTGFEGCDRHDQTCKTSSPIDQHCIEKSY